MNMMKFDFDMLDKCIDVYKKTQEQTPYIICSKKTFDLIRSKAGSYIISDNILTTSYNIGNVDIQIDTSDEKYKHGMYYGCRILIDDDLKLGDVFVAK